MVATFVGTAIRLGGLAAQSLGPEAPAGRGRRWPAWWWPASAIAFAEITGKSAQNVLFSGQNALPGLVLQASTWTVGALVVLVIAKSIAYSVSLSAFRGGPIFPAMFIGGAIGVAGSPTCRAWYWSPRWPWASAP